MRSLIVMALLCALGGSARAQRALTLDEALVIARRNNRDLAQARARLEQSAAGIEQAWAALLPQASAQGKYTHNYREVAVQIPGPGGMPETVVFQRSEQLDGTVNVTAPLLALPAYPALGAARQTYAAAQANLKVTEATVLLAAAQAFFAAAGSDEVLVARRHAIAVAQQTLDNARTRFSAGTVTRVEVTRAELALLRAQQSEAEAVDAQAQAYRALATVLVLGEPFHVTPAEEPGTSGAAQEEGEQVQLALRLRPEFLALERTIAASEAQASSARWRWAPSLSGFGVLRGFNYAGFAGDNYSWAVGLQVDWLLYDGGTRDAQRHLAWAQQRESEQRLDLLRSTVSDDVRNARASLLTKRRALETAHRSVTLSTETLTLVRTQHSAGTATQLDLLQAQDALVAAEVGLAQARFDLALADLTLRRTVGTFAQ
ncbi:MAG TPA: TolC family protein [Polyangia bacterium]|nr:TolC family protein [Polyangia bacterium]